MEFKEKSRQTSITTSTSNGDINYDLNYNVQEGKLMYLNGTVTHTVQPKDGDITPATTDNLGSFSVGISVDNPTINLNLNASCTIADKQTILADIYTILDELTASVSANS